MIQSMKYIFNLVFYHTITPLHVGCGQDVGVVDLPVIRERITVYPFIPGSGIRGSLRDRIEDLEEGQKEKPSTEMFGPRVEDPEREEEAFAGCVSIHDGRILLYPVRSDCKVFLWITCPAVLRRFTRDCEVFVPGASLPKCPDYQPGEEQLLGQFRAGEKVHLEEFQYEAAAGGAAGSAAQGLRSLAQELEKRIGLEGLSDRTVLVSDKAFHHFVNYATMVTQRNRLTSAKTVEGGALFSVEAVPPETVFYGFLGTTASRREGGSSKLSDQGKVLSHLRESVFKLNQDVLESFLHLGGDESTGSGVTRLILDGGGEP